MSLNVIKGPAAVSFVARNLRRYWTGVASHNRFAAKNRVSPTKAIEDAKKLEKKYG
jgi:hypothetical protein